MAEQRAQQFVQAKRKRGIASGRLTCLGDCISCLEDREEYTETDRSAIKRLIARVDEIDEEYRTLHDTVVALIEEDEEALQKQQEACDIHDDKVLGYLECLDTLDAAVNAAKEPRLQQRIRFRQ